MSDLKVTTNGPYEVRGLPLIRMRFVVAKESVNHQWVDGEVIDTSPHSDEDGTYWLCRCGRSESKPFCDDSHLKDEPTPFDGTENPQRHTPYREVAKTFEGPGGVVRSAAPICAHVGFCTADGSPPWRRVREDDPQAHASERRMVDFCPSGTLTRAESVADEDIEAHLPLRIGVVDDGPYFVTGGASLSGSEGDYEIRNRMTLCRCGQSAQMPFCDSTHEKVGFRDS